ncbi:MAG: segregation/condensation protein A [Planctomycetota bacterium]|nr:segregation/condensation protein A [Planctomycetota bacterium]
MLTDDYRVRIDAFEGPLDLLLFLIRKNEVEITDIPIAAIADQFITFLEKIERVDIDVAGEFLLMAATLMEIKSRMLSPRPELPRDDSAGAEQEDPRSELVKQLLAYKQYRDAASRLEARWSEWQARYPAHAANPKPAAPTEESELTDESDVGGPIEVDDLDLLDLVEAFRKIMDTVNFERLGEHQVTYDDTPIELHAEDILDRLRRLEVPLDAGDVNAPTTKAEMDLATVITGRTRSEMIGVFLAVLDLVRRRAVHVRQDKIEGGIYLSLSGEQMLDPNVATAADVANRA